MQPLPVCPAPPCPAPPCQMGLVLSCTYRYKAMMDGRDVARTFALTSRFWLDVLATVPFVYLVRCTRPVSPPSAPVEWRFETPMRP